MFNSRITTAARTGVAAACIGMAGRHLYGCLAQQEGLDRRYWGGQLSTPVGERSIGEIISEGAAARLGAEKFVSLTTFKRNGDARASPMWIVRDGAELLVWTPADASKVKRVRRDPRVSLTACGRTGNVKAGQPAFDGTAEVITDPATVARAESLIKHKYGLEFRVVTLIETIAARGRKPRVVMRITLSGLKSDQL